MEKGSSSTTFSHPQTLVGISRGIPVEKLATAVYAPRKANVVEHIGTVFAHFPIICGACLIDGIIAWVGSDVLFSDNFTPAEFYIARVHPVGAQLGDQFVYPGGRFGLGVCPIRFGCLAHDGFPPLSIRCITARLVPEGEKI